MMDGRNASAYEEKMMTDKQRDYLKQIIKETENYQSEKEMIDQEIRQLYRLKETKEIRAQIGHLNSKLSLMRRPVSFGEEMAARAWAEGSRYAQVDMPVLRSIGTTWIEDCLQTFRKAGISEFFYLGEGPNGFKSFITFCEYGCKMVGFSEESGPGCDRKGEPIRVKGVTFML